MTKSPGQPNKSDSADQCAGEPTHRDTDGSTESAEAESVDGRNVDGQNVDRLNVDRQNVDVVQKNNADPLIGTKLADRYELLSVCASGGMGIVYRGRHILMDKIVAIKVLNAAYANEPGALARFQHEAKVACQLSHPNIVVVHDFGITDENMFYLVMDFVEGRTLEQILDDAAGLPVSRVLDFAFQLVDGLEYAHEGGLIHRDLKPSNIMIVETKDGREQVKILDFGLAKFVGEGKQQALSQTGYVMGSGYYMSPEQCRGKRADVRSEIYAIGCVLYEALVGLPPHVGDNLLETCQKHIEETPQAMAVIRPDLNIPPAVETVVKQALEKDPQARFQTAAELRVALEKAKQAVRSVLSDEGAAVAPGAASKENFENTANATILPAVPKATSTFRQFGLLVGITAVAIVATFQFSGTGLLGKLAPLQPSAPVSAPPQIGGDRPKAAVTSIGSATEMPQVTPSASDSTAWANYYHQAGTALAREQYDSAEKLLQQAVSEARRSGSKPELLLALRKLEDVLYLQKKFKEADALYPEVHLLTAASAVVPAGQAALAAATKIDPLTELGKASESEDDRIAHLAMSCHKKGQCDTAASLLEHSVAVAKRMYGPKSLKTASRITDLASLYMALDQPAKAQPLMDEVMEIKAAQHTGQ